MQQAASLCGVRRCLHGRSSLLQSGDLRQDLCGFCFQRSAQRLVIFGWILASLVVEVQVAQIFIDDLFALFEVCKTRLVGGPLEHHARREYICEKSGSEKNAGGCDHNSVSLRACSRYRSSAGGVPAVGGLGGRPFQLRINIAAVNEPPKK